MNRIFLNIGPFTIYWYSVMILLAVLVAYFIAIIESKKQNMNSYISDLAFYTVIFGVLGARLYYVIFNFSVYKNNLLSIFKVWEGGLAIYGGIIGGLLTIIYFAKKNNIGILRTTDIIVPGVIVAQAIGRWGNFFNQEAFGSKVTLEFLQKLHLPNFIINGMYIEGNYYHPTFLYESLWCIFGFIMILIIRKITKGKEGIPTYTYFIWYGIGRFLIESIRTDSLYLGSLRISQVVSIIIFIIGIVGIIKENLKKSKNKCIK